MGGGYVVEHDGQEFDDYYSSGDIIFSPDSPPHGLLAENMADPFMWWMDMKYLKSDDNLKAASGAITSPLARTAAVGLRAERNGAMYAVISGMEYGPMSY